MATPLHARPCFPPHCCLRLFHLDLKHKQKLGHEPQETRSPWSLWGHGMEEKGGGERAGRAVPSRIPMSPLHLSLKLEHQWDGQGGREREHNKEDRDRGKNQNTEGSRETVTDYSDPLGERSQ